MNWLTSMMNFNWWYGYMVSYTPITTECTLAFLKAGVLVTENVRN